MARRDPKPQPHPTDPSRRRRIPNPDEYERGKRDGQDQEPTTDKPALLLARLAWDLTIHGPTGGPARTRSDTYRWLTTTPAGRAALGLIWAGIHTATSGYLLLLAVRVRRAELIGAAT